MSCKDFLGSLLLYQTELRQHGWGLPEGVEPPIIHNPLLGWLLLPLAPSAIPMRVVGALTPNNSSLL